ncbi:MAG: RagB/SusD family nutrient uptake outer membrane protein [Candidatus Cryptobacteroides sp.]
MRRFKMTVLFAMLLATGCTTKFLEVQPTTTIPKENSYKTEADITKALMAAYSPLLWQDWSYSEYHPIQFLSDILADDYAGVGGNGESDVPYMHVMRRFQLTPELSPVGLWKTMYAGVYRANLVVENMDRVENVSEGKRTRILAEARTLRAYYYSWLWKFWGNIPYYTENPDGAERPYIIGQKKADDVYAAIMEDLDWVTSENRLPQLVTYTEVGRLTRAAAQMLRADVVMLQGDVSRYASVLEQLREIIASDIYALTPKFADIWEDSGEWNAESVFELNYSDSPSSRTWENPTAPGGTCYPVFLLPDSYKGSKFHSEGYGFGPVSEKLYREVYDVDDQRRDAGILNFKEACPGEKYNPRLDDTGYFNLKYCARKGGNSNYVASGKSINFRNNLRVWRYSQTLLLASELIVRTGGNQAEADELLNMVRARAWSVKQLTEGDALWRKATLENLMAENRLEFFGEGHRFWDLLRYRRDGLQAADNVLAGRGYTDDKRYLPIPQSEMDRAENTLLQNPY